MADEAPAPITYAVDSRSGFVTLEFGREMTWVALTREQAEEMAARLIAAAATLAPAAAMGGRYKLTIDDSKVFIRKPDGTMIQ